MKKIIWAIALCLSCASFAHSQVIAFDNFDYADGSLVPNGGWANHSGTAGDLLVAGGQAVIQHGTPSEDANLAFAGVTGDLFYGIDFSVSSVGQIVGGDYEYFAHFREANNFSARLDVVEALGGGDFSVGIASDESTADAVWATDLSFGTTYRAVVGFDQDANIAQLWIDAALETDTSILGEDRTDPGDAVESFALRQSDSSLNETVTVDNLVIGESFGDVVNAVAVPEPTSAVLFGLAGLGLCVVRRRS